MNRLEELFPLRIQFSHERPVETTKQGLAFKRSKEEII